MTTPPSTPKLFIPIPANMALSFSGDTLKICVTGLMPTMNGLTSVVSAAFNPVTMPLLPGYNIDPKKYIPQVPKIPKPLIPVLPLTLPDPLMPKYKLPSYDAVYMATA